MKISVVVLFKNCAFICNVLDNILSQIIDDDEIIVVNDHSDDKYLNLLNKYESIDQVTVVNSDKSECRSYNRNLGAKLCKNELLLFIDGDVLLYPNTIQKCKQKFAIGSEIAIAGSIHGLEFTREQLAVMGSDYLIDLHNIDWDLHKNDLLKDYRTKISTSSISRDWEWLYMYSGMFFVLRKKYTEIGGFNENLASWGGEDVEFAYRLKQVGKVKYARDLNGIHLPHKRDHIKNLKANIMNLYKMLATYKNIYFELPIKFNNPSVISAILEENIQTNMIQCNPPLLPDGKNYITINYAKKVFYNTESNRQESLCLYGSALPFRNGFFRLAIISQDVVMYGSSFFAIVVQEALRVAREVIIRKTSIDPHGYYISASDDATIRANAIHNFSVSINTSIKNYSIHEYPDYYTVDRLPPFIEVEL